MFPGGKTKAVTFSYDDGIVSDKKLVKILNEYGMKGTFNVNSGIMTHASNWDYMGFRAMRMTVAERPRKYRADAAWATRSNVGADIT